MSTRQIVFRSILFLTIAWSFGPLTSLVGAGRADGMSTLYYGIGGTIVLLVSLVLHRRVEKIHQHQDARTPDRIDANRKRPLYLIGPAVIILVIGIVALIAGVILGEWILALGLVPAAVVAHELWPPNNLSEEHIRAVAPLFHPFHPKTLKQLAWIVLGTMGLMVVIVVLALNR